MTLISATNHVGNDYIVMYETILATKMSISATDYIGHVHIGHRSIWTWPTAKHSSQVQSACGTHYLLKYASYRRTVSRLN